MNDAIRGGTSLGPRVAVVGVFSRHFVVMLVSRGRGRRRLAVCSQRMAEVQHLGHDSEEQHQNATKPDEATPAPGG